MTEPSDQVDSTTPSSPPPMAHGGAPLPDGALPPVEPPAAGFIVQLFLIPLIIVAIIVTVWLMFSWLAHRGSRPEEMVKDIERLDASSWEKAFHLANSLRDPRNDQLRNDATVAGRLAEVLDRQLGEGRLDKERLSFRIYLARALGEFEVIDGVPVLVRTARTERDSSEVNVRRAALQSLGRLAETIDDQLMVESAPELISAVVEAASSQSDDPDQRRLRGRLRSTATFVLGLFSDSVARDRLVLSLSDAYPDARYNAAIGLARHGDVRAIEQLLEMLDPESTAVIESESEGSETEQQRKRVHVMKNALRAVGQLADEDSSQADLTELTRSIEQLRANDSIPWLNSLHVEMDQSLQRLQGHAAALSR